jgi:hypothetical protein
MRVPSVIIAGLITGVCYGQSLFDQIDVKNASIGGFHLYGVSVFSQYTTSVYPFGGISLNQSSGIPALGGDIGYGVSATAGWQRHREKTNLSIRYSGSYSGMVRYSNLDAFSHSLSISATRSLTPKWTAVLSASGDDATVAQFLFQPEQVAVLSQAPLSFDDFAAAMAVGQFSNAQIASLLTGAPVLESPARAMILGDHILSYSAQASLNYAYSSRLSFHIGSFTTAGRNRATGDQAAASAVAQQSYVIPRSSGGEAGVTMSYMLSPRTELGLGVGENLLVNRYQRGFGTTATASVGRKMGTRWFMRAYGGGSLLQVTEQVGNAPKGVQFVGGGSLGIQSYAQSLAGSYDRSTFDTFGFAAGTNTSISASWSRRRPGSRWSLYASIGEQQIRNNGFANISGWEGSAGLTVSLTAGSALSIGYVHLNNAGNYAGAANKFAVDSIRVSLGWSPQASVH